MLSENHLSVEPKAIGFTVGDKMGEKTSIFLNIMEIWGNYSQHIKMTFAQFFVPTDILEKLTLVAESQSQSIDWVDRLHRKSRSVWWYDD